MCTETYNQAWERDFINRCNPLHPSPPSGLSFFLFFASFTTGSTKPTGPTKHGPGSMRRLDRPLIAQLVHSSHRTNYRVKAQYLPKNAEDDFIVGSAANLCAPTLNKNVVYKQLVQRLLPAVIHPLFLSLMENISYSEAYFPKLLKRKSFIGLKCITGLSYVAPRTEIDMKDTKP